MLQNVYLTFSFRTFIYITTSWKTNQGCKLYSFMKDLQTFHYLGNDDLNEQTVWMTFI